MHFISLYSFINRLYVIYIKLLLGLIIMTNEKSNGKRRTLSQSEVMMDFRKWHETNDTSYREKIILDNMELVSNIVNKVYSMDPSIDEDDLTQIGMLGLIKAIDTFDYQNSHRFVTYTSIVIRREIALNIYINNKYANDIDSLDTINIEEIEDPNSIFDEEILKNYSIHLFVDPVLDKLTPRNRSIIIDYFGLYGNNCLTQKETAIKNNISPERVRQIIAKFRRMIIRKMIQKKSYREMYLYL